MKLSTSAQYYKLTSLIASHSLLRNTSIFYGGASLRLAAGKRQHFVPKVQTSRMTTPMKMSLQIHPFCKCRGCITKAKKALGKIEDVILLAMDPEIGKFVIITTKHPEVMKYALKHKFPRKNIILSQEINHSYALPHVDDIAKAMVTMSQVTGLGTMEYTHSTTFKLDFTNHHNQATLSSISPTLLNLGGANGVHLEHAPPPPPPTANITPSAPPIPTTPYGYPAEFYGYNKNHPHGY